MDKKLIYISSRYEGKSEEKDFVEKLILELIEEDKRNHRDNYVYISPLHCFDFIYPINEDLFIDSCLKLLQQCNEIWVCPNYNNNPKATNVLMELGFAKGVNNMNITYL